jgi:hypothetical protein
VCVRLCLVRVPDCEKRLPQSSWLQMYAIVLDPNLVFHFTIAIVIVSKGLVVSEQTALRKVSLALCALSPNNTGPCTSREHGSALAVGRSRCADKLRALESSLSASELAHVDAGGRTAMHRLAGSLYFLKAGELSSLVPWPNASRTIYESSIKHTVLRALGPVVRTMLERSPSLASAADERGVTVLHLAARKGELACRCAASLAPGQRETRTRTSACSVQRQWPRS